MSNALVGFVQEAQYGGVTFPVEVAEGGFKHDNVKHKSYGRPGADIEPTGVDAESGTLTIPFINDVPGYGVLFPDTYSALRQAIKQTPLGTLLHPILGSFTALMEDWHEVFTADTANGCIVTIHWTENSASVANLVTDSSSTPQDSAAATMAAAAAADAAMFAIAPSGFTLTTPVVATALAALDGSQLGPQDIANQIGSIVNAAATNLALPLFAATSAATTTSYTATQALETLRATALSLNDRYFPDSIRLRTFTVPATMPVWQVAVLVYGDASLAGLISAANPIPDPLNIPAGTVLQILPNGNAGTSSTATPASSSS